MTVRINKSILVSLLFIVLLGVATLYTVLSVSNKEEKYCFDVLRGESEQMATEIEKDMKENINEMRLISSMLSEYESIYAPEVINLVKNFQPDPTISYLEVITPEGKVITKTGEIVDKGIDFYDIYRRGAHVSDIESSYVRENSRVVRTCVPVIRYGKPMAVVCATVRIEKLAQTWRSTAYKGKGYVYLMDGKTGDFIVNGYNGKSKSLWDIGKREVKDGRDNGLIQQDYAHGGEGYAAIFSPIAKDYIYLYYRPVHVNSWRVAVAVAGKQEFEMAKQVHKTLYGFIVLEVIVFMGYFAWLARYLYGESLEKQHRLDMVRFMKNVEEKLFTAHLKHENIVYALEDISSMAGADGAYFKYLSSDDRIRLYRWCKKGAELPGDIDENELLGFIQPGDTHLICHRNNFYKKTKPELYAMLDKIDMDNLVLSSIKDMNGLPVGVLALVNFARDEVAVDIMNSVKVSFSMLYNNLKSYDTIKRISESDLLTGLKNRNSYEKAVAKYKSRSTDLACVFADANGLHELNNEKGHEEGDRMLKLVAHEMQKAFGRENTYRIGGDEFVAFVEGMEPDKIVALTDEIRRAVSEGGYNVSIGVSHKTETKAIESLVKESEMLMYEEKKAHYKAIGKNIRKTR